MGAVKKYFNMLDFVGHEIGFEDQGTTIFKTNQGAFFSTLTLITIIVLSFMFGSEIYERKNPIMIYSNNVVNNSVVSIENFPTVITFLWPNGTLIEDYSLYVVPTIQVYKFDSKGKTTFLTNYTFGNCSLKSLGGHSDLFVGFNGTIASSVCPNFDEYMTFYNDYTLPNSGFINYRFLQCNPSTSKCDPNLEYYIKNLIITLTYINSYVDSSDQKNPIKYYLDKLTEQVNDVFFKRNILGFPTNQFNSDNGWLLQDVTTYNYLSLDSITTEINPASGASAGVLYAISLQSPTLRQQIDRNYMKVQELFAKVGGLANALLIFIKLITFHFTRFSYILYLENLSNEPEELTQKIKEKESNTTVNKKSSFTNLLNSDQILNLKENSQFILNDKDVSEDNLKTQMKDKISFNFDIDKNTKSKHINNDKLNKVNQLCGINNNISIEKVYAEEGMQSGNNLKEQGIITLPKNVINNLKAISSNLPNGINRKIKDAKFGYFDYLLSILCCNNERKQVYKVMFESIERKISLLSFSKITNMI